MSNYDCALINATWLSWMDEQFQCARIEKLYANRSDAEVVIKMRRITQGCGVIKAEPKVVIERIAYHSCLCHPNFQHPDMGYFMTIYNNHEKGNLPFTGGTLDQPAQVMELIQIMATLHHDREKEIQEKQSKKKG